MYNTTFEMSAFALRLKQRAEFQHQKKNLNWKYTILSHYHLNTTLFLHHGLLLLYMLMLNDGITFSQFPLSPPHPSTVVSLVFLDRESFGAGIHLLESTVYWDNAV